MTIRRASLCLVVVAYCVTVCCTWGNDKSAPMKSILHSLTSSNSNFFPTLGALFVIQCTSKKNEQPVNILIRVSEWSQNSFLKAELRAIGEAWNKVCSHLSGARAAILELVESASWL